VGKPQAVISEEALAERNEKLRRSRDVPVVETVSSNNPYSGKFKPREEMPKAEDGKSDQAFAVLKHAQISLFLVYPIMIFW